MPPPPPDLSIQGHKNVLTNNSPGYLTLSKVYFENILGKGETLLRFLRIFSKDKSNNLTYFCHLEMLSIWQCFDNGKVGKQPAAWKEYHAESWLTLSK